MKLVEKPRLEILYKQDNLIIPVQKGQISLITDFIRNLEEIDTNKEYVVKIEKLKLKRSLDANAYMWTLIRQLGVKLHKSYTEIYKEMVRENGVFEIVPIRQNAIDKWITNWQSRGYGWICEDLGECRNIKGYHNVKSYYGSSTYDTKEMAQLIDAVVFECKEQGIETLTPNEIEKLKQQWGK
jgi:hypothetical protein